MKIFKTYTYFFNRREVTPGGEMGHLSVSYNIFTYLKSQLLGQ